MRTNTEITAENIREESYHNLVMLSHLTGYTNPALAIASTGGTITVKRDSCGNIFAATVVAPRKALMLSGSMIVIDTINEEV